MKRTWYADHISISRIAKIPVSLQTKEKTMPIDQNSPLWGLLADWIKILLTLPDPPPEPLRQLTDVAIFTAIGVLSERLSTEAGAELRRALPQVNAVLRSTGAKA